MADEIVFYKESDDGRRRRVPADHYEVDASDALADGNLRVFVFRWVFCVAGGELR